MSAEEGVNGGLLQNSVFSCFIFWECHFQDSKRKLPGTSKDPFCYLQSEVPLPLVAEGWKDFLFTFPQVL